MKYILPGTVAIFMMASCADEFDPQFEVERPTDLAKIAELADYAPLKEYINREAHPTFKLGAALDAAEFNKKLTEFNVGVTNFDEVVAGNAMKYASCVSDKGVYDFSTVNTFVNTATNAGISVYGHTLAWHSQQRPKYLNTLIADKPIPVDPNASTEKEVVDYTLDFGTVTNLSWNGCPADVTIEYGKDDCLVFSNTAPIDPWYAFQYWVVNGINLKEGTEYTITINCRFEGEQDASVNFKLGDWGGGLERSSMGVPANGDFADYTIKGKATMDSNGIFLQHGSGFVGTMYWKSVKISHMEKAGPSNVEYVEVWSNELPDPKTLKVGDAVANFVVRDANNNDAAAVLVDEGGVPAIKIVGKTNPAEEWDTQFFIYTPNKKWEGGEKYRFTMKYKASKAIGTDTQIHGTPGGYIHWAMLSPNPSFTTEWQTKTWEATIPGEGGGNQQTIAFNLNKNKSDDPGTSYIYYIAEVSWESCALKEVPKMEHVVTEYINNGDMEGSDANSFVLNDKANGMRREIQDGVGVGGSRGIKITSPAGAAEDWDTQFWIALNDGMWLQEGEEVTVQFDYKASRNASADTQSHGAPGGYQHWACVGSPNFTTEWQTYKYNLKVDGSMAGASGLGSIAFNLSKDRDNDVTYYFDNIRVWSEKDVEVKSTIPLTPEEKHDTIAWAMEQWIAGMMDACEGKVKAWDVVNEAISGGGNVDGKYALQHGSEDNKDDFFWQDYLGDEDYVRTAVRLARKYYAKSLEDQEMADDGQLKLFINDYNLESDWDQNGKVKSLIEWIKVWESDGVTKIDGIGTQMHISYYEDAKTLESKKAAIVESFKLMAATGKLVRISELDLGYVDATGKSVDKKDMTVAMEKTMSEYYKWIIEQYFANVPAAQQYGITQWCLRDASGNVGDTSGWRPGEPVGIWDSNWYRKYVYVGWTEGLAK